MMKNLFLILLTFNFINLYAQNNVSYDFSFGAKQPIIEGVSTTDRLDTCYNVTRLTAHKYDNISFAIAGGIKYRIHEKIKLGLTAEINYIKNEEFNYFTTPLYKDIIAIPIRLSMEIELASFRIGHFTLKNEFGYLFKNNLIAEDVIEEKGGMNYLGELNYYFEGKLKGIFLSLGYEWYQDKIIWDIYKAFGLNKPSCPIYSFKTNKHYLTFRIGITI